MPLHSERGVTEPDVCPLLECDSILPALPVYWLWIHAAVHGTDGLIRPRLWATLLFILTRSGS